MLELANEAVARKLTVRDIERRAKDAAPRKSKTGGRDRSTRTSDAAIRDITDALRRRLQTDVSISVGANERGELRVSFYSADDLERLLDLIIGPERSKSSS